MHDAPSLRDRKKQRTHRVLQDVALRLFAERGFDEVTVDDIVERAEVSRSTFFRYFPTKEDVVVDRAGDQLGQLRETFARSPADEPVLRSLRIAVQAVAAGYEGQRSAFVTMRRIARDHPSITARGLEHQAVVEATLADLLAERMPPGPDIDLRAKVVAGAVMSAIRVALDQWMDSDRPANLQDLLGDTFDVLGEGLGSALTQT